MGACGSKPKTDDGDDNAPQGETRDAGEAAPPKQQGFEDTDDAICHEPIGDYYDLGDEIGRGGFSVVVDAVKKKNSQRVAVKCIEKKMVEGEDIKLLIREVKIMKRLNHPHILKLFEVFEDDKSYYLVMELVEGKELFDKIVERGQYSEKDTARIINQIVSAVAYLHENDIAHRDLKPENLLSAGSDENEIIKIADFGFSKNFGEEKLMTSCGSPGYVAPEVLTCESYDNSVDMWSIGVILYILLCGYPPFYADNAPALFKKIMDVQYDFDDPSWDDVSEDAKNLIKALLVKEPGDRLTAAQVLEHPWVTGETATGKMIQTQKLKEYQAENK
jgi:calcium/calmodulin-dependent protein kinase I